MKLEHGELTERIIGCAIAVHRQLGPGFLESVYENAILIEMTSAGLLVERQKSVDVLYRGEVVGSHRLDFLVGDLVVVELKAIKALEDIHFAQTRSYLKSLGLQHGLLFNFATMPLTIKRVLLDRAPQTA